MRPSSEEGFRLGLLPEGGLLLTKQSRCPLEAPPDFVSETQALLGLNAVITEHGGGVSRPHPPCRRARALGRYDLWPHVACIAIEAMSHTRLDPILARELGLGYQRYFQGRQNLDNTLSTSAGAVK